MDDHPETTSKGSCVQRAGTKVSEGLELFFYKLGYETAKRPWTVIMCCLLGSALCGLGLLRFQMKDMSEPIWVPPGSKVLANQRWVEEHFPLKYRFNEIMFVTGNVLTPGALAGMMKIDKVVKSIAETNSSKDALNYNWTSICMRYGPDCWSSSLLSLWANNEALISTLTESDIVAKVNEALADEISGRASLLRRLLGDVTYDTLGKVISARAAKMYWVIRSSLNNELDTNAKVPELDWERQFIKATLSQKKEFSASSIDIYVRAVRSFRDESDNSFNADVALLMVGVVIIITYVAIVLGKFNEVEHKVYLALVGVFGIGLASLVAYGLASAVGMFYGPIHPILPFLLLGVGVDDMFVIIEAWNNLTPTQRDTDLRNRVALTMKNAGVSVTVTSITDCVAFSIGASTELPALRSFCVYAALGIFALYIMQATFFVAWLTIDARRQEALRDACCMFIRYMHFTPNKCSRKEFLPWFLRKFYAPALTTVPAKASISAIALAIFGVTIYGSYKLRTDSDLDWFLPTDSYLTAYLRASEKFYPDDGLMVSLYIGNIDYYAERSRLTQLQSDLSEKDYVVHGSLQSWHKDYMNWLQLASRSDIRATGLNPADGYPLTEEAFYNNLLLFLNTPGGMRHAVDLKWNTTDWSQTTQRKINATRITFTIKNQASSTKEVQAMDSMDSLTSQYFGSDAFVWVSLFRNWETNRVIQSELYMNLCLAFVAVLLVTLTLVANVWMCVLVCLCVIVNVVNVCGFMHFWGLTIDTLTSILLILSIGLAVDYSAHIGHMFMMVNGTKDERTRRTVSLIGPAVVHGGFSTFLAFVLLSNSNSYVFITFFKVFFLVVVFGLFNGITLLPVVLSWVGPAPHLNASTGPPSASRSGSTNINGQVHQNTPQSVTGSVAADNGGTTITLQKPSCNGKLKHTITEAAHDDPLTSTKVNETIGCSLSQQRAYSQQAITKAYHVNGAPKQHVPPAYQDDQLEEMVTLLEGDREAQIHCGGSGLKHIGGIPTSGDDKANSMERRHSGVHHQTDTSAAAGQSVKDSSSKRTSYIVEDSATVTADRVLPPIDSDKPLGLS